MDDEKVSLTALVYCALLAGVLLGMVVLKAVALDRANGAS